VIERDQYKNRAMQQVRERDHGVLQSWNPKTGLAVERDDGIQILVGQPIAAPDVGHDEPALVDAPGRRQSQFYDRIGFGRSFARAAGRAVHVNINPPGPDFWLALTILIGAAMLGAVVVGLSWPIFVLVALVGLKGFRGTPCPPEAARAPWRVSDLPRAGAPNNKKAGPPRPGRSSKF
jgi:hypothetical protein